MRHSKKKAGRVAGRVSVGLSVAALLNGCSPMAISMKDATVSKTIATSTGTATLAATSPDYSCLDNRVDYTLATDIVDFEMTDGFGMQFGFSPMGAGPLGAIHLGGSYSRGDLKTTMHLSDPMKPGVPLVDKDGDGTKTNFSIDFGFTVGLFNIGPSYYSQTPVAELSMKALTDNIQNVKAGIAALPPTPWWTHISKLVNQNGFIIPVGSGSGIQIGDELQVMDATYQWGGDGTACKGEFLMALLNSNTPLAIATVSQVTADTSFLTVKSASGRIANYNYVTISNLVQPTGKHAVARTSLKRSIRVGAVASRPLTFIEQDGTSRNVDIGVFIQDQLKTLLGDAAEDTFYTHL